MTQPAKTGNEDEADDESYEDDSDDEDDTEEEEEKVPAAPVNGNGESLPVHVQRN